MVLILSLNSAVEAIKKKYPGCYITRGMLMRAIDSKRLACLQVGTRKLVNMEQVEDYLSNACTLEGKDGSKKGIVK